MKTKPAFPVSQNSFEQWTYDNAQQKIVILTSAPTAAVPQIREGDIGYFNNVLYFVVGGILKQVSVSSTP